LAVGQLKKRKETEEKPADTVEEDKKTKKAKKEAQNVPQIEDQAVPIEVITTYSYSTELPWKKTVKRIIKKVTNLLVSLIPKEWQD
jgi:hypothetical protein